MNQIHKIEYIKNKIYDDSKLQRLFKVVQRVKKIT